MKTPLLFVRAALSTLITLSTLSLVAAPLELITQIDPSVGAPINGNCDSRAPLVSPDGRYVLFASSANNLVLTSNNVPIPALMPLHNNIYVRDRTRGVTELVSLDVTGTMGGNRDSLPMGISSDGRYVLFESEASNLVSDDTNKVADLFVRDRLNGVTLLASANTNGLPGNGASHNGTLTPDGRYVAFTSAASDLVSDDTNQISDIFVRDLQSSVTRMASVGAISATFVKTIPSGFSDAPDITSDGRYVVFFSTATNLVVNDGITASGDVYVRDMVNGTTVWASKDARAIVQSTNVVSYNHVISADGQYVAYEANTNLSSVGNILRFNLVTGLTDLVSTNAWAPFGLSQDIHDLDMTPDGQKIAFVASSGDPLDKMTFISVWNAGNGLTSNFSGGLNPEIITNTQCDWPALDSSGRYVVFQHASPNPDTNALSGIYHLYRHDLQAGTNLLVNTDAHGVGAPLGATSVPSVSADGRIVAFECADSMPTLNDRNRLADVLVCDLNAGTSEMVSLHDPALGSITPNGSSLLGAECVSSDGRYVVFANIANNLVPNDTNTCSDVYVRDLLSGTNILVSVAANGLVGNGESREPVISANGRYVAFTSVADNLINGDTNQNADIFVRDLWNGTTTLASVNSDGSILMNEKSYPPRISNDGRFVYFFTMSNSLHNIYVRDQQLNKTYHVATNGQNALLAVMSSDGKYVVINTGSGSGLNSPLVIWSSQSNRLTRLAVTVPGSWYSHFSLLSISPDDRYILGYYSPNLYAIDWQTSSKILIQSNSSAAFWTSSKFSGDGRYLVYTIQMRDFGKISKSVYLYDFVTASNQLISGSMTNASASDISADGRFIVYRGEVVVPMASIDYGLCGIYVYDRSNGTTMLLDGGQTKELTLDRRSINPVFSGDGRTIVFQSRASNLVSQDFNLSLDLFAFRFISASLIPGSDGVWVSWPYVSGNTYQVQFKESLDAPVWHDLSGSVTNTGNKAFLKDTKASTGHRFYRINAN